MCLPPECLIFEGAGSLDQAAEFCLAEAARVEVWRDVHDAAADAAKLRPPLFIF
jgi:hypothetical protein